jgi:hypothetical protein
MGESVAMICPTAKAEYFCRQDWTGRLGLIFQENFVSIGTPEDAAPCSHAEHFSEIVSDPRHVRSWSASRLRCGPR